MRPRLIHTAAGGTAKSSAGFLFTLPPRLCPRSFRATWWDDDSPAPLGEDEQLVAFSSPANSKVHVLLACPQGRL